MTEDAENTTLCPESKTWWGEYKFQLNQSHAWRLGPLYFRLFRREKDWLVEYHRLHKQTEMRKDWVRLDEETQLPQPSKFERFMFNRSKEKFFLMPRLADRGVVIKPVQPIYIPAGQRATLFISTPLWLAGIVENQKAPIFDFPVFQTKDTWFGMNYQEGQMCYATQVDGTTNLAEMSINPFRAVTPIHFYNDSHQQMRLERINVPAPSLPLLYSESTGRLWTSEIKVYQNEVDKPPRIRIESRTPPMAEQVSFIQPARSDSASFISNMFESMF